MKDKMKKITTLIAAFVIAFTALPALGGNLDVNAAGAKAPVQVKSLRASNVKQSSVKLSWSKIAKNRNTKGYAIYRNGKLIKRVSFKSNTFTDTKLKAGTKYAYTVRAYNTYKQKQYYNSKTKKWQNKKPAAKQWKGKKTRTATVYKYGKVSAVKNVTTKKVVKKVAAKPTSTKNKTTSANTSSSGSVSKDSVFAGSKMQAKDSFGKNTSTDIVYMDDIDSFYYLLKTSKTGIEDAIKWTTDNPLVATVERQLWNGTEAKVTCKKAGKATITATNWDGQKKTVTIKVEAKKSSSTGNSTGGSTGETSGNNSGSNNSNSTESGNSQKVTSIAFYTNYYGTTYPGEDAIDCKNTIRYDENGNDLVENSYFVLRAYLYPNFGANTVKPVQWTIKENTIGATTEVKGRNLIIKTPKYTSREQFNGKLVISMAAEGFTQEMEFEPVFPMEIVEYNDLLNYKMTPDKERQFLWGDFGGAYSNEMKVTVKDLTARCATDRQKVEAILTWFKRNVEYKNDGTSSYTLRGTWRNRYGVCAGQAGLLAQMLRYADIPAGRYVLEASKNHACTMFWMDGKWYYADPTLCCKGNVSCSVERAYVVINDGDKLGCIVGDWYAGGILKSNFC